jgi:hypothetical protein
MLEGEAKQAVSEERPLTKDDTLLQPVPAALDDEATRTQAVQEDGSLVSDAVPAPLKDDAGVVVHDVAPHAVPSDAGAGEVAPDDVTGLPSTDLMPVERESEVVESQPALPSAPALQDDDLAVTAATSMPAASEQPALRDIQNTEPPARTARSEQEPPPVPSKLSPSGVGVPKTPVAAAATAPVALQ